MKIDVIYQKSCQRMTELPNECIDTILTSCPYWGLRDYGEDVKEIWGGDPDCEHSWGNDILPEGNKSGPHGPGSTIGAKYRIGQDGARRGKGSNFCSKCNAWHGQLGLEPTFQLYLDHMMIVCAEIKRVLKKTGSFWLNMGDTYYSDCTVRKAGKDAFLRKGDSNYDEYLRSSVNAGISKTHRRNFSQRELQSKCLIGIPWRLVLRLVDEQGWILRNAGIWNKPNSMPSSTKDRLSNSYEFLFHLVKNTKPQYYWNEKTALMADRKPSKIQEIEDIDWEWRECSRCLGKGNIEETICPRCKGTGKIKHSFWHSLGYWYDLDAIREPYTEPLNRWGGNKIKVPEKTKWKTLEERAKWSASAKEKQSRPYSAGKNPGDLWRAEEVCDFPVFAVKEHTTILGIKEFENFSNFISFVINKLIDGSFAVSLGSDDSDTTEFSEDIRDFQKQFLSARPMQPNLISIGGSPYATITIKQTSNNISIEFGRNRWIFTSESFSRSHLKQDQIKSHFFAIDTQGKSVPFFVLMNWMEGLPLPFDIINQLRIFRSKSDGIATISDKKTAIAKEQTQNISRMRGEAAKIFFVQGFLTVALNNSGVSVSEPSLVMKRAKSTSPIFSLTKGTFPHIIYYKDFPEKVNTVGDVWTIPTQPRPEAHFATFPDKLCIKPILATCPLEICKKCGKARVRITKSKFTAHTGTTQSEYQKGMSANRLALLRQAAREAGGEYINERETIGWTDCGCNAGWDSGVLLDPFGGRGTSAVMAKKMGRHYIVYELKKEYCEKLIKPALEEIDPLFNWKTPSPVAG